MFERGVSVHFSEDGIGATFPSGTRSEVKWSDVIEVSIETNDSGPWGADVWWTFKTKDGEFSLPQGSKGEEKVLGVVSARFARFDHSAVIKAMGCTSNAKFLCWSAEWEST